MRLEKYNRCSRAALKLEKADIVLKNAKIVNVFTDRVEEGDIAITEGMIVGIGDYEGVEEVNLEGQYVTSGLINAHLHLESTLVNPQTYIARAVAHGTTTFIVDPHEAANVSGTDGIDYLLEQTKDCPANVFFMIASCVPATPIDDNGYILKAKDMEKYLHNRRVLGLGEVMDYVSVIEGEPEMNAKIELFDGKVKDGHAPGLSEAELAAYAMAGITTDHEAVDYETIIRERSMGMTCHIREGSAARNLEKIIRGIVENNDNTEGFCFCTDDKHIEDIDKEGDINHNVRKAVSMGIRPIAAIKMATIQAARCYGLRRTGAVAPGFDADLVVWDSIKEFNAQRVMYKGKWVDSKLRVKPKATDKKLLGTVHLAPIDPKKLEIPATEQPYPVLKMIQGETLTEKVMMVLPSKDGVFVPDGNINKIASFERHHATGKIGVGAVTGFGLKSGAIASSVSHDSHNIIVIGTNDEDMLLAVKELERTQGGYTIVEDGEVIDTLELPVMGLMTDRPYREVQKKVASMVRKAHKMGVMKGIDPFITLSFMGLPVIPDLRCVPRGMYSVSERRFV